ncbi:MAG TPA: hypothetical protein PK760_04115 [Flavobacteriales bacterium]|nr:hypothetical protein [Flavobacteriales bacterium]
MLRDPSTGLLIQLAIAFAMALIAFNKGFKPWHWFLACGLIGLIALLLQPSAKAGDIDLEMRVERRRKGNKLGAVLSLATIAMMVIVVILNIARHYNRI